MATDTGVSPASARLTTAAPDSRRTKVFAFASHVRRLLHRAARHPDRRRPRCATSAAGCRPAPTRLAWVQTSYLIAEIIVIPLSGWLSRVMSTRWLFCVSAVGFTITSLLCGWAWNIESMIVFRALQGFLGGSMIPTVFTTAFVYLHGHAAGDAAATIGAIASLAPTLGPDDRRLDHRQLVLALAVLHQSRARRLRRRRRCRCWCGSTSPNLSLLNAAPTISAWC